MWFSSNNTEEEEEEKEKQEELKKKKLLAIREKQLRKHFKIHDFVKTPLSYGIVMEYSWERTHFVVFEVDTYDERHYKHWELWSVESQEVKDEILEMYQDFRRRKNMKGLETNSYCDIC